MLKSQIVSLRELRYNTGEYIKKVSRGESFIIWRRSKPVFRIAPIDNDDDWQEVVDFTKIKKGGIAIKELLKRL